MRRFVARLHFLSSQKNQAMSLAMWSSEGRTKSQESRCLRLGVARAHFEEMIVPKTLLVRICRFATNFRLP